MTNPRSWAPGPWIVAHHDIVLKGHCEGGDIVCTAPTQWPRSMEWWEGNAYLLRAAPALYEALEELFELTGDYSPDELRFEAARERAAAVMASARGEGSCEL